MPSESNTRGLSIRAASPPTAPRLGRLQAFHVLSETPCPYLPERQERKLFTEVIGPRATRLYSELSRGGFRRSHMFAYRPACTGCQACVPVRVAARTFRCGKSLRRVARKNADLQALERPPVATQEQFRVFRAYVRSRHGDGEMSRMNYADYQAMIEETHLETGLVEFRDRNDVLRGAILADWLDDGISAVYSYFDPRQDARSLGTYMILSLIDHAVASGRDYVYLGYWIAGSQKMAYKQRFRPLEALVDGDWRVLDPL